MKKILRKAIVLVLAIITCLSVSACSIVQLDGSNSNGNVVYQDSKQLAQAVTFNSSQLPTYNVNDAMIEAVARVDRASVAIGMKKANGTASNASGTIIDVKVDTNVSDDNSIYILTCQHVINDKGTITVYIPDDNCEYYMEDYTFMGTIGNSIYTNTTIKTEDYGEVDNAVFLVGGDVESDIAVIRIDLNKRAVSGNKLSMNKIQKVTINENATVRKGETVFAIGNPTGELPGSVCSGIISYPIRQVDLDIGTMQLMQIDATINPGNSGGGLFNLKGELIAVTNAGNTGYEAINYAIPMVVDQAAEIDNGFVNIAKQLIGTCTDSNYGYISGRKEKFGLTVTQESDSQGDFIYVSAFTADSQASKSGLKINDIITKAKVTRNGAVIEQNDAITKLEHFTKVVSNTEIGDVLSITIDRYINSGIRKVFSSTETFTMTVNQYHFCNTGK